MEINQSEFLPDGVQFVSKYRLQHGDIVLDYNQRGKLSEAKAKDNNLLEYLFEHNRINEKAYYAANTFKAWQEAYRAKQASYVVSRYGEIKGESNSEQDNRYLFVLRNLTRNELDAIENLYSTKSRLIRYNEALDRLVQIIEALK